MPSIEARLKDLLDETRLAMALFGFQFTVVLTDSFERLPPVSRAVHHRIAAGGNAEEGVLRCAVAMMLPAEGLIALGMVGGAYVTVRMISENNALALSLAVAAALGFLALLYGFPLASRRSRS